MARLTFFRNFVPWKKLKKSILEQRTQDWFKWLVLIVCLVVVYYQIIECWMKLQNPPITSHSTLTLNDSMTYPALTVCREPPYNKKVFPKFNFSTHHIGSFPCTSQWKFFPYDLYNISDFWNEAVYDKNVFSSCSLNQNSVESRISSSLHLKSGMCHTIRPNFTVFQVGRKSGYSLLLNHDLYGYRPLLDEEPGWKIFIHEPMEKFSDNINFMSSRQDHVFVPVGEITEVAVDAYQFNILQNCSSEENYSVTECEEKCSINEDIIPYANCTVPWFPSLNKPLCSNSMELLTVVKATHAMKNRNCCIKNCRATYYKNFVVKRTACPPERKLSSTAMIYFSSKTVITMEERFSYKWGDFLGEIGGTVGFLLGLSIVGVIGVLGNVIRFLFCQKEEKVSKKNERKVSLVDDSIVSRTPAVGGGVPTPTY